MKVRFFNIYWDTDGEYIKSLPQEINLEVSSMCDIDNEGADILSDKFGFCVRFFSWENV